MVISVEIRGYGSDNEDSEGETPFGATTMRALPQLTRVAFAALLLSGLATFPVQAAPFSWIGPDHGDWHTPGNWSPAGPPTYSSIAAYLEDGDIVDVTTTNGEVKSLYIGKTSGAAELHVSGSADLLTGSGYLGYDDSTTGTATVSGEGNVWQSTLKLWLGGTDTADGGSASLDVSGGGRLYVGDIDPATVGVGSSLSAVVVSDDDANGGELLLRHGATLSNTFQAYLGYSTGHNGTATVTGAGSSWTNNHYLIVGQEGEGTLNVSDGATVSNSNGYVGRMSGSIGTATVSGGDWTNTASLSVGEAGQGTLNVGVGGSVSNTFGYVGQSAGSTGGVTVDGGTWSNSSILWVGTSGEGTLTVSNGGSVSNTTGFVGRLSGSTGSVRVSDEDSVWQSSENLWLGGTGSEDGGSASLDLTDGGRVFVGDIQPTTFIPGFGPSDSALLISDDDTTGGELLLRNEATVTNDGGAFLGYGAGEGGTVTVSGDGSSWTNVWSLSVGEHGEGTLTVTDEGSVSSNSGYLGRYAGSAGTATVDGGTWTNASNLYVGREGEGVLTVKGGGSVSGSSGFVARYSASTSTATVDGGSWTNSFELVVGGRGDGTLWVSGGGSVSNTIGRVGGGSGGAGTVTVNGGTWTNSSELHVGEYGEGTLTVTGGGSVSNTLGWVGQQSGATGTVTVNGGTWTNSSDLYVGEYGEGTLTVTGGGSVSNTLGWVGQQSGATGTVTVNGGTWTNSSDLCIGHEGEGTLTITGEGNVSSADGSIGEESGSTGTVTVESGDWTNTAWLFVGREGQGVLTVNAGGSVSDTYGHVGYDRGSAGTVTVDGGTWTNSMYLYVGELGDGTLTVTGGGTVSNKDGFVAHSAGTTGTVTVSGAASVWRNMLDLTLGGRDEYDGGSASLDLSGGSRVFVGDVDPATAIDLPDTVLVVSDDDSLGGQLLLRNGATINNDGSAYLGLNTGEHGTATVTGAGSTLDTFDFLYVGYQGEGMLTVTDGGTVSNGNGDVGHASGSSGTVTLDSGTWTNSGGLNLGGRSDAAGGTGTVTVSPDGLLAVGETLRIWPLGTLNLHGGTVRFD